MPAHRLPRLERATIHPQLNGPDRNTQAACGFSGRATGANLKLLEAL